LHGNNLAYERYGTLAAECRQSNSNCKQFCLEVEWQRHIETVCFSAT